MIVKSNNQGPSHVARAWPAPGKTWSERNAWKLSKHPEIQKLQNEDRTIPAPRCDVLMKLDVEWNNLKIQIDIQACLADVLAKTTPIKANNGEKGQTVLSN